MQTIKTRWQAESPDFFKKITNTALTVFVIASGIESVLVTMALPVHTIAHTILIGIATASLGIAKISKLTVDADKLTEEEKEKLLK